jgi:hypothetical protein
MLVCERVRWQQATDLSHLRELLGSCKVALDLLEYLDLGRLRDWLDVDPTFDTNWRNWISARPFAFCPSLSDAVRTLGKLDFERTAMLADDALNAARAIPGYDGLIKQESLSATQLKFVAGVTKSDTGRLRAVRLDKAMLSIYAMNRALLDRGQTLVKPVIYVSAYNLTGLSKFYNKASGERKAEIRHALKTQLNQADSFVGDFLKGGKASLSFCVLAHPILLGFADVKVFVPNQIEHAIETPSQKFTTAAQGEDFAVSCKATLPTQFTRYR